MGEGTEVDTIRTMDMVTEAVTIHFMCREEDLRIWVLRADGDCRVTYPSVNLGSFRKGLGKYA